MNILQELVPVNKLTVPEYREWLVGIEERIAAHPAAVDRHSEVEGGITLEHVFTPGLYTREIFMPAGALVVSRIHLHEHPFIISQGKVSVYDGETIEVHEAPYIGVTAPGTKRILYTHEDTVWATFHVTDKKTLDELDVNGVITCDTFKEYDMLEDKETLWLG